MGNQRYGVFIPCYNAASTIEETLASVKKAIEKTGRQIDTYIYDDCSKDNSRELLQQLLTAAYKGFYLVCNAMNVGERATTNEAFRTLQDKCDWLFIIHADDIVKDNWLTSQITALEDVDSTNCFTVWSSYDTFSNQGVVKSGDDSGSIIHMNKDHTMIMNYVTKVSSSWHISGAGLNVRLYNLLNGFDVNMPQYGDTEFFVRALLAGFTDMYIAKTLTLYRISSTSVSGVSYATNRDIREIYMLIDRFRDLLSRDEMRKMYKLIAGMALRRMIKGGLGFKPAYAVANLKQYLKAQKLSRTA